MNFLLNFGADILVIAASLGAMCYCIVLSRRLNRLTSFDKGLGGAIAVMSSQVDQMKAALQEAKAGSDGAGKQLHDLVHQARDISAELEMMIAACHDFAEEAISVQTFDADEEEADPGAPQAEDAPQIEEDAASEAVEPEADVTPIFGSRRKLDISQQDEPPTQVPLFRHRKATAV